MRDDIVDVGDMVRVMLGRDEDSYLGLVTDVTEDGRTFIPLHDGLIDELGWQIGDDVELRNTPHGFRLVNLSFDER